MESDEESSPHSPHAPQVPQAEVAKLEAAAPFLQRLVEVVTGDPAGSVQEALKWLSQRDDGATACVVKHRRRLSQMPTTAPPPVPAKPSAPVLPAAGQHKSVLLTSPPPLVLMPQASHNRQTIKKMNLDDMPPLVMSRLDEYRRGRSPEKDGRGYGVTLNGDTREPSREASKKYLSPEMHAQCGSSGGMTARSFVDQSGLSDLILSPNSGPSKRSGELSRGPSMLSLRPPASARATQEDCLKAVESYEWGLGLRQKSSFHLNRPALKRNASERGTVHCVADDAALRQVDFMLGNLGPAEFGAVQSTPLSTADGSAPNSVQTTDLLPPPVKHPLASRSSTPPRGDVKSPHSIRTLGSPPPPVEVTKIASPTDGFPSPQSDPAKKRNRLRPKALALLGLPPVSISRSPSAKSPISGEFSRQHTWDTDPAPNTQQPGAHERVRLFDTESAGATQNGDLTYDIDQVSVGFGGESPPARHAAKPDPLLGRPRRASLGSVQPEAEAAVAAMTGMVSPGLDSPVRARRSSGDSVAAAAAAAAAVAARIKSPLRHPDAAAFQRSKSKSMASVLSDASGDFGHFPESFRRLVEDKQASRQSPPNAPASETPHHHHDTSVPTRRRGTLLSSGSGGVDASGRTVADRGSIWSLALRARLTMIPTTAEDSAGLAAEESDLVPLGSSSDDGLLQHTQRASNTVKRQSCGTDSSLSKEANETSMGKSGTDMREYLEELPQNEEQKAAEERMKFFNWLDQKWGVVIFTYTLYNLFIIPARCGLDEPATIPFIVVDLLLDLLLFVDIYWKFRRPFEVKGRAVTDPKAISKNYMFSLLPWDCLACFPTDLIGFIVFAVQGESDSPWRNKHVIISPWWRVNKLLLARYADAQFTAAFRGMLERSPLVARATRTVWTFVLTAHYVTCLHLLVLYHEGEEAGIRFTNTDEIWDFENKTTYLQYSLAFDYCVKAMVGMGRPGRIIPVTDLHVLMAILAAFIGVCTYAMVLATISNLVSQEVSEKARWRRRMDEIYDVLSYLQRGASIPPDFSTECVAYFHHEFWVSRVLLGRAHEVLGDLPHVLENKINRIVVGDTLSRVALFRPVAGDTGFLSFMLTKLEPTTFCKGERIMTKGEEGDCMYFIMHGDMGIFDEGSGRIVFVCKPGTGLGEIALLHDCRRTATVVALDYCSCFVLKKEAFLEAEKLFPDVCHMVRAEGEEKLQKIKIAEIVGKVPLFTPYKDDPNFMDLVVAKLEPKVHPEGTLIVEKGDQCSSLFFVTQGELKVEGEAEALPVTVGDYFGEVSILFDGRSTVTLTAASSVILFTLPADDVEVAFDAFPDLARELYSTGISRYVHYVMTDLLRKVTSRAEFLSPEFLKEVAVRLQPMSIKDDDIVHMTGDELHGAYFLARGSMAEIDPSDDTVSRYLHEGDHYGTISFLRRYLSSCTLMALEECVVYFLSRDDYEDLVKTYPTECELLNDVARDEMRTVVCRRLYQFTDRGNLARSFFKLLGFARLSRFERLQRLQTRDQIATLLSSVHAKSPTVTGPTGPMASPRRQHNQRYASPTSSSPTSQMKSTGRSRGRSLRLSQVQAQLSASEGEGSSELESPSPKVKGNSA